MAALAEQDEKITKRIKNFYRSRFFSVYGTLFLVLLVIALKGASGEGQTSLFGNLVKKYVEETAASVANFVPSQNQSAFVSASLKNNFSSDYGRGGNEATFDPQTIQQNSLLANNPVSTDFVENNEKRNQIVEYTVQKGDLLSFIASDYGVSVNSIIWANNLRDADSISPGQILKIPPVSGVIHKVKRGDTVASIAKKYGAGAENIIEFNVLPQDGQLQLDDELIVPDGKLKGSAAAAIAKNSTFSHLPNLGGYYLIPATGYNWGRIHGRNGVDVANSCGTTILAAAGGTVAISDAVGWNGGFGKFIKLTHPNGTETFYAHASKLLVLAGETIAKGQEIAKMGSTGRSTGCHLHFEVHGAKNPLAK